MIHPPPLAAAHLLGGAGHKLPAGQHAVVVLPGGPFVPVVPGGGGMWGGRGGYGGVLGNVGEIQTHPLTTPTSPTPWCEEGRNLEAI